MTRQPACVRQAQDLLDGIDPILDGVIAEHGPAALRSALPASARFASLAESIAYQQLNGSAAATIWGRVVAAVDGQVTPVALLAAGHDRLRACGLSTAKTLSMLDLSTRSADGEITFERIGRLSDDEVVASLIRVRGIGRWTAQMFLMFTLGRVDIWPTGDYGVRSGFATGWGLDAHPTEREMEVLGEPFTGARSLVAWYCWRVTDAAKGSSTGRS